MHVSSENLLAGLGQLALWVSGFGLIAVITIWLARRRGSATLALDVTRNAALLYLCVLVVGVGLNAFQMLGQTTLILSDEAYADVQEQQDNLRSSACTLDFDPLPLLCGHTVGPVPFGPRLLVFIGTALGIAASAAVALAIHNATRRAAEREPFHASVARTFATMAIVVMVAAATGDLLRQIGMTLAAQSLDWGADAYPFRFGLSVELWPFAVAVGLFALSAIFRYGAQLQREKELLQRETDGLV